VSVHKWGVALTRADMKGKHSQHCMCWHPCKHFYPDTDHNCPIAQALYEFDQRYDVVTPVWECVSFVEDAERVRDDVYRSMVSKETAEGIVIRPPMAQALGDAAT